MRAALLRSAALIALAACSAPVDTSGTDSASATGGMAGIGGQPGFSPPIPNEPVQCVEAYADTTSGAPLLDPPLSCTQSLRSCSDGQVYQLLCDGLTCDCLRNGLGAGAIYTPGCLDIYRAAAQCGWPELVPIEPPPPVSMPGDKCGGDSDVGSPQCSCRDGFVSCPTSNGCVLDGRYVQPDTGLLLTLTTQGTLFASMEETATFDRIENGRSKGFYGTWQLREETLFTKTVHFPRADDCDDRVGSYAMEMSEDCQAMTLQVIKDSCMERTALASGHFERQQP